MKLKNLSTLKRLIVFTTAGLVLLLPSLPAEEILEGLAVGQIREKIDLSEEQTTKLETLTENYREQSTALKNKIPTADSPATRQALVREMTDLAMANRKAVKQLLSEQQFAELQTLHTDRLEENRKPDQPDYRKQLDMSPEQALQFRAVLAVYMPGVQELMQELQQAEGLRQKRKISKSLKALRDEMDGEIQGVLNQSQQQVWQTIQKERRAEMRAEMK